MEEFYVLDSDDPSQYEKWISIWLTGGSNDVFAHPEYVRLFKRECDRAVCAVQESMAGSIILPLILRPIAAEVWAGDNNLYYDVAAPYGYGGPFANGTYDTEGFWREFTTWAETSKIICAFFRISPYAADFKGLVDNLETNGKIVIRSLSEGKEGIWKDFKHAVRTCVRSAKQAGLSVEFDIKGERILDFRRNYYQTMQRVQASQRYFFSPALFDNIIKNLSGQFIFAHVLYRGKVIASKLILVSKEHLYPFLGGADKEYFGLNPNPLLDTAIFYWGIDNGKKTCVLGGGKDGQDDGVFKYKKKYAPSGVFPFVIGKHVFDRNAYLNMCEKRKQYENDNGVKWKIDETFFPAYRSKSE